MFTFKIETLPQIVFAHKFKANEYHWVIPQRKKQLEITAITEGELSIEPNGQKYLAQSGDIICNFHRTPMKVDSSGYHSHHTVCFMYDLEPEEHSDEDLEEIQAPITSPKIFSKVLFLIDEIIKTNALYPENNLKISGLFIQLLGELNNYRQRICSNCSPIEQKYIRQVKKYIYDHISEPIMQKDIASHIGVTPEYLCAFFKKCEGQSVIHFINEIKLKYIRTIMQTKHIPLNRAAAQYGFSDPNYVSKLYKKYYNESITQAAKATGFLPDDIFDPSKQNAKN